MAKTIRRRRAASLATRAVHAGSQAEVRGLLTTPIIQTSTFTFKDSKEIEGYTRRGKDHYEYGRYGNPTVTIAEKRLANLEGLRTACLLLGYECDHHHDPIPGPVG